MRCGRHDRRASALFAGLVLVAIALLGGGCGNAKRDFRVHELNPGIQRVAEQRSQLAALLRVSRPHNGAGARALHTQLASLGAAMRHVAGLSPPDGVKGEFRRYTAANAALLAGLTRFVDAFAAGSRQGQRRARGEVEDALAHASRAQTELQHALR